MIVQVHHLSELLHTQEMDQQMVPRHGVEDETQLGVEDEAQRGVEDEAQHGVEDEVQHVVEDEAQHEVEDEAQHEVEDEARQGVEDVVEHQQHLIQIMPFQKLQEPGRQMRNHKVFYIDIGKYLVPQFHLMTTPLQ